MIRYMVQLARALAIEGMRRLPQSILPGMLNALSQLPPKLPASLLS